MSQPNNDNAGRQAAEQANAYKSDFAPTPLKLDDGTVIEVPPHPNLRLLDDEALPAFERLQVELESFDHHEVQLPERTIRDDEGNEMLLPSETKPGALKYPHRKTDPESGEVEFLDPPYQVRVAQIALGGDDYRKLRAGTIDGARGAARHVWQIWNEQGLRLTKRADADPKSDAGSGVLEDVAEADSERPVEVSSPADS